MAKTKKKKNQFLVANDTACMFTNVDRLSYRRFFSAIKLFVVRWFYNKPKKHSYYNLVKPW